MKIEDKTNRRIKIAVSVLVFTGVAGIYTVNTMFKITSSEVQAQEVVSNELKVNTNLLQSIGAQLMECRIKQMKENCKSYGVGSEVCHLFKNVDRDGIFTDIKNNKYDEIEISIRVDQALTSCKGIYE